MAFRATPSLGHQPTAARSRDATRVALSTSLHLAPLVRLPLKVARRAMHQLADGSNAGGRRSTRQFHAGSAASLLKLHGGLFGQSGSCFAAVSEADTDHLQLTKTDILIIT